MHPIRTARSTSAMAAAALSCAFTAGASRWVQPDSDAAPAKHFRAVVNFAPPQWSCASRNPCMWSSHPRVSVFISNIYELDYPQIIHTLSTHYPHIIHMLSVL